MRPRKDKEARTVSLSVRITPELRERIDNAALARGISITDTVVLALDRGLRGTEELPDLFEE